MEDGGIVGGAPFVVDGCDGGWGGGGGMEAFGYDGDAMTNTSMECGKWQVIYYRPPRYIGRLLDSLLVNRVPQNSRVESSPSKRLT